MMEQATEAEVPVTSEEVASEQVMLNYSQHFPLNAIIDGGCDG